MIISEHLSIPDSEVELHAIRAQGSGGQNVNKVSSAIHLRFQVQQSSLPDLYKNRLLNLKDRRINSDGIVVIKAQQYRTQEKNRLDALERLRQLILSVTYVEKKRIPTKASKRSQRKRLDKKTQRGFIKSLRGKVSDS